MSILHQLDPSERRPISLQLSPTHTHTAAGYCSVFHPSQLAGDGLSFIFSTYGQGDMSSTITSSSNIRERARVGRFFPSRIVPTGPPSVRIIPRVIANPSYNPGGLMCIMASLTRPVLPERPSPFHPVYMACIEWRGANEHYTGKRSAERGDK